MAINVRNCTRAYSRSVLQTLYGGSEFNCSLLCLFGGHKAALVFCFKKLHQIDSFLAKNFQQISTTNRESRIESFNCVQDIFNQGNFLSDTVDLSLSPRCFLQHSLFLAENQKVSWVKFFIQYR